jgi:hypothetical protein
LQISARAASARAQVGYFLSAVGFFVVVLRAAVLRVVLPGLFLAAGFLAAGTVTSGVAEA